MEKTMDNMGNINSFFKRNDPILTACGGVELNPSWWSRPYEYAWAKLFAGPELIVADMGAGWSGRPFKEELAKTCKYVYAVDRDPRLLELPNEHGNLEFHIADFEQPVPLPQDVDVVFCLSVLEDLTKYKDALSEFRRLLKPGGLLVMTFDCQYDMKKPLSTYPGVSFPLLFNSIQDAGFELPEEFDFDKDGAVFHEEWNLCCFHMVVQK
jgi:SAM-dependent methyltransferase